MKLHWTERSIKAYLFRIVADFIDQLENKMESLPISQGDFAQKLGVSKGRVSQILNCRGNITLKTIVHCARALGMKVSMVAYEDDDPQNKKGPINPEIFRICWEKSDKPRDLWDIQEAANTNITVATYHLATVNVDVPNVSSKIYDVNLFYGRAILPGNVATYPTIYFPVGHFAGNQSQDILKKNELLPS